MDPDPLAILCDACGALIEGTAVIDHMQSFHTWCYSRAFAEAEEASRGDAQEQE